jgi:hypothetical protein
MRTGRFLLMTIQTDSINLDTLTIAQVAEKINVKDNESAKKWLKNCGIKLHKFSKIPFVYEVEVASEIDKPFVLNLRHQFPDKWKERYRDVVKNHAVYNILVSKIENIPTQIPTTKARRINKKDEVRYKKILG